jgi:hypothetical protein
MAVTVKHSKVSTIPDDADTSLVRPSDWNADHTLVGTIDVPNGGTGATTLTGYVKGNGTSAMTAVATVPSTDITGLGTMSTQNANAVAITGGTINGTTIGATTPSTVNATTLSGQTGVLRGTGQNLFTRSQQFSFWASVGGASNVTGTDNASTAPDGTSTATNVVPNTTNGLHRTYSPLTNTVSSGAVYTMTLYAKANGYRYLFVNASNLGMSAVFDVQDGNVTNGVSTSATITAVTGATGWYKLVLVGTATVTAIPAIYYQFQSSYALGDQSFAGNGTSGILMWGAQLEFGSTANTYIPTTTTAVYGTPTLSFSGVSTIGLESNGSLFVQPAGTGALQAQATTSTTAGGNARGANAVDWQTSRSNAAQVAFGSFTVIGGGNNNNNSGFGGVICGGTSNTIGTYGVLGGGFSNQAIGSYSVVGGGYTNSATGFYNFIGNGFANSGTANAAVTTQAAATNGVTSGSTAVTLSGSNASIRVGQLITGTGINSNPNTYVAAISGTTLTLSQNATATGTPTLSFFTPHGVVVGGGNNQATGSYSFIGGGGDAGTAANRNVASGDWSVVGGGARNVASGIAAVISGGGIDSAYNISGNTASGASSAICGGRGHTASGNEATVLGGAACTANGLASVVFGRTSTTRGITGNVVFSGSYSPISGTGSSQAGLLVLARQTTDATATALTCDGAAAGTTNQVILPNNSAYFFTGEVVSGVTGGGNTKGWTIEGVIKRGANAASTALVGTPTVTSMYADVGAATWAIAVTADTTNGGLRVTFTGQAATTIRTVCQIRTTEMTY